MVRDIGDNAEITSVRLNEQASAPVSPAAGYSHVFVKSDGLYLVNDSDEEIGPFITGTVDVSARVFNSVDLAVSHNTGTMVGFNGERYDTHSFHVGSSSQLVCPASGKYLIVGQFAFEANASGFRRARIILNGSTSLAHLVEPVPDGTRDTYFNISTIYNLTAGQYVELEAYQNSGGNLNVLASANASPEFMIQKVG